jgi:hypothetical protein
MSVAPPVSARAKVPGSGAMLAPGTVDPGLYTRRLLFVKWPIEVLPYVEPVKLTLEAEFTLVG